jgi:hypothetical protein
MSDKDNLINPTEAQERELFFYLNMLGKADEIDGTLLTKWRTIAYNTRKDTDAKVMNRFWNVYFELEKNAYAQLLENPDEEVKGTVKELAEKLGMDLMSMIGFLDGTNDSLIEKTDLESLTEDTVVTLSYDKEVLYKNMVEAKADWLYGLEQWDRIFPKEKQEELYTEQKKAHTVVKGKKIGRNDPCPCGSGKKYKQCCGRNA